MGRELSPLKRGDAVEFASAVWSVRHINRTGSSREGREFLYDLDHVVGTPDEHYRTWRRINRVRLDALKPLTAMEVIAWAAR